jgi:hypothetical protein
MSAIVDRYARCAERFGFELVFETAAGLGRSRAELSVIELVDLARRLKSIDARFDPGKPDKLVGAAGVEPRGAYLERIAPVGASAHGLQLELFEEAPSP